MIRSLKDAIYVSTSKAEMPNDEEWATILAESAAIVNSRPLMPVETSIDAEGVITPAHFILGMKNYNIGVQASPDYSSSLIKAYLKVNAVMRDIWQRFLREYIPKLNRCPKWHKKLQNVAVGDIVLMLDKQAPRGRWPKAKVIDVTKTHEGLVRSVVVEVDGKTLRKSVQTLAPLVECELETAPWQEPEMVAEMQLFQYKLRHLWPK